MSRPLRYLLYLLVGLAALLGLFYLAFPSLFAYVAETTREIIDFLKRYFLALLAAFFLVKGKFIWALFVRKVVMMSATELSKRYVMEQIVAHNLKRHFFDHIKEDLSRLARHLAHRFKRFPLAKRLMTVAAFIGSLGIVGKIAGAALFIKVVLARIWSFLLRVTLRIGNLVTLFFVEVLWQGILLPLLELLLLSRLWRLLAHLPGMELLLRLLRRLYDLFGRYFGALLRRYVQLPLKRLLRRAALRIREMIYAYIGFRKENAWQRLQKLRTLRPSYRTILRQKAPLKARHKPTRVRKREKKSRYLIRREDRVRSSLRRRGYRLWQSRRSPHHRSV